MPPDILAIIKRNTIIIGSFENNNFLIKVENWFLNCANGNNHGQD